MRILVHDYAGHPFQAQLSRALAARGHDVVHAFSASNPTCPTGSLVRLPDDPASLEFAPIALPRAVAKSSFVDRWRLERLYGRKLAARIAAVRPDIVIAANTPLDALAPLARACARRSTPWVFWLQDMIGPASLRILRRKLPVAGLAIGAWYCLLETRLLAASAAVVGITDGFREEALKAGVREDRYRTIPNWAPLEEIAPRPRANPWSQAQGLAGSFVFLYSGTLGFKHNPALLLGLAQALRDDPAAMVVVNSEGPAADWLGREAAAAGLGNLRVNPFQPYGAMSDVLATADVLISILEPEAGIFSVPSKVLTYHCAARPMLLAVPAENLAARIVTAERTGLVADPRDAQAFIAAARQLRADEPTRTAMAGRARAYAERNFDIATIAGRFESVFAQCLAPGPGIREAQGGNLDTKRLLKRRTT